MLESIEDAFAYECYALEEITLEALPRLKTIDDHFATRCRLHRLVIEHLPSLERFKPTFCGLDALTHFALRDLPLLGCINSYFLNRSCCLVSIELRDLLELTTIGLMFAASCPQLSKIDLVP